MTDPQFTYFCDYSRSKQLGAMERFGRSSAATTVDKLGKLVSSPVGSPRFDYSSLNLRSQGLLMESQNTNLLPQSQCDTGWVGIGTPAPDIANSSTFAGESCAAITFKTTDPVGYDNCRAARYEYFAAVTGDTYYFWQIRVAVSRPLAAGESFIVYYTGRYGLNMVTIDSSHSVSTNAGTFVTISAPGVTASGGGGDDYPVIFPTSKMSSNLTVYLNCGQVERSNSPSSYIPTTTAPVTRAQDTLTVDQSRLSRIISPQEGTIVFYGTAGMPVENTGSSAEALMSLSDGTGSNFITIPRSPDGIVFCRVRRGDSDLFNGSSGVVVGEGVVVKAALAYRSGYWAGAVNGTGTLFGTYALPPPVFDRLQIGACPNLAPYRGFVRGWGTIGRALSLAELENITK